MAFQVIVEWVAHGLEAMGIAVVSVGGSAAMINFARRVVAGDAFEAESSVLRERLAPQPCSASSSLSRPTSSRPWRRCRRRRAS